MQVRIDDIKVRKRIRKSVGDLSSLMESMRKYGLLQPIVIDSENTLLAGYRRLEAARQLGWKTIPVVVVNRTENLDRAEIELEENVQRKDFSLEELSEASIALEKLRNPNLFVRLWKKFINWLRKLFKRKKTRPSA
ncbi:MAG TPA: ParB N-terminal domain-containing protein [Spirochaetales bacterium]|nr:ParB N-terminal domain-containing protein [Spirochaetales bacterium]